MASDQSQLPIVDISSNPRCCKMAYVAVGAGIGLGLTFLLLLAFFAGRQSTQSETSWNGIPSSQVPAELLNATASHGGVNMAVCTATVGENAEGFFALDFITGNLRGWVYYPQHRRFGAMFMTNVSGQLGMTGKNPEYVLVSGATASAPTGGNLRPASSMLYVADLHSGYFAAYVIPWDKTAESSNVDQGGELIAAGVGQIREPWGAGAKKPPAAPAAGAKKPAAPDKAGVDPNNPDPNAVDPNNPAGNNRNLNNNNPNNRKK